MARRRFKIVVDNRAANLRIAAWRTNLNPLKRLSRKASHNFVSAFVACWRSRRLIRTFACFGPRMAFAPHPARALGARHPLPAARGEGKACGFRRAKMFPSKLPLVRIQSCGWGQERYPDN